MVMHKPQTARPSSGDLFAASIAAPTLSQERQPVAPLACDSSPIAALAPLTALGCGQSSLTSLCPANQFAASLASLHPSWRAIAGGQSLARRIPWHPYRYAAAKSILAATDSLKRSPLPSTLQAIQTYRLHAILGDFPRYVQTGAAPHPLSVSAIGMRHCAALGTPRTPAMARTPLLRLCHSALSVSRLPQRPKCR
jgi:hypothetical protein